LEKETVSEEINVVLYKIPIPYLADMKHNYIVETVCLLTYNVSLFPASFN